MADRTWTKLTVTAPTERQEEVCAVMCLLDNGLMIEDYSDFSFSGMYGELVDESILEADTTKVSVSIFVPQEKPLPEYRGFLVERLSALAIPFTIEAENLAEEDWADGWKKYYHPIHVGRLSIVPVWEEYTPSDGEVVVLMDPGMAFGTGTHETTHLVLTCLEREIKGGERLLDVGCGSGILSICAARLGATFCAAYDIDPVAVAVTRENIATAQLDSIICEQSDLLQDVDRSEPYTFVVANIVADILLRMLPDLPALLAPHAKIILSGIISERAEELLSVLPGFGFAVDYVEVENDWTAIVATYQKDE